MDGFRDRAEAAHRLASELKSLRGQRPLVLAIPRGAVPMGRILAEELDGDLDVVLVRKVGAPYNPELALGAVDETGQLYRIPQARALATEDWLMAEARAQQKVIAERRARLGRPPVDPAGRVVVVVDDGIATGSTMAAALRSLRNRGAKALIAAIPVAPPDSLRRLEPLADRIVCLVEDPNLFAISTYYLDFRQVSDDEVARELRALEEAT